MQLRTAKLCLDCEELHEEQQCPVCASEMFAYLTRWIPVEDRRSRRRPPRPLPQQKSQIGRLAQGGAIGLAAFAVSRWLWSSSSTAPQPSADKREDETESGN